MPFPVTRVLDDFGRADEGPPPSAQWVTSLGDGLEVKGNNCGTDDAVTGGGGSWNTSFGANQECFTTITVVPPVGTSVNLRIRTVTAADRDSDHYEIDILAVAAANDVAQFWKRASGVWTQLGPDVDLGGNITAGEEYGIRGIGTNLEGFRTGVSLGTRSDSDVTGGGFIGVELADVLIRIDNFGGGSFTGFPFPTRPNPAILSR